MKLWNMNRLCCRNSCSVGYQGKSKYVHYMSLFLKTGLTMFTLKALLNLIDLKLKKINHMLPKI